MTETKTLQELAGNTRKWFELAERRSGEDYWRTKDGHPEWIEEMCHEAHNSPVIGDLLPEDYRYGFIVQALDALEECEDPDEAYEDLPEEIYTYNVMQWLGSHNSRYCYVDEARENFGGSDSVINEIMAGYRMEQEEVLGIVRSALEDRLEETEE